ncbi:acyltransferase-like protein At1g54570, chloroplastic isoform X2 [Triticum aestivum]|uniref:acyltransferase-like protein At1g54570, chloroplastic isoform X2 n=1 Tax=Triticum aestivum TaxID=4565 RepID=UPI001D019E04|nr:acyltransferase-like protein At1g54570, chloroplastic isoform X2 [Triticum aestivum]
MSATIATPTPLQLQIRVAPDAPRTRWRATTCRARPASLPDAQVVTGRKGVSEYVEAAQQLTRWPDGGPPRWFSPLECGGAGGRISGAPTLLYLPGIDGVGLGLIRHHEALAKIFVLWCLHIPVKDRTSFEGLVEYVERTVKLESSRAPDRPVYLVGESIGACIALAVAARNRDTDLVLILVNPGTSFHKSKLQSLSAFLDLIPEPFHLNSPEFLNFLTENFMQMLLTFIGRGTYLEEGGQALSEFLVDVLPRETIVWKLQMLRIASSFVNSRLHAVRAQTLVLASGYDVLLPSREEAQRLQSMLENCRVRHFRDNGHTILLEGGFDIVTTIKGAGYYRRSSQTDFIADYLPPTPSELKKILDSFGYHFSSLTSLATYVFLRLLLVTINFWNFRILNFANLVMLSTLPDGKIVRGLAGLPEEGPVVLVGYHMLMALELVPLVAGVLSSTGINLRGLGHPFLFNKYSEQLLPESSLFDVCRILGAVPVTTFNFYKLLSEKHFVLLYPGGAREVLHRKGEEYKLFWPEQPEFVRMASRFGAKIIPFGVVGEDDICDVLLDYNDLLKLPFYDIMDKKLNKDSVKLRADCTGEIQNQPIHPMVVLPKVPGRFYFIFGKPIETRGREMELTEKENAQHMYLHVKSEVENCIKYLKEKREEDPYRSILPRLLYQAVHGHNAEIPTFEL